MFANQLLIVMGAGVSAVQEKAFADALTTLRDSHSKNRESTLKNLVTACDTPEYKLMISKHEILTELRKILDGTNKNEKELAATCFWYLSRDAECKSILTNPKFGLMPLLVKNLSESESCFKCTVNLMQSVAHQDYLLSRELGLMSTVLSNWESFYKIVDCITVVLKKVNLELFLSHQPIEVASRVLLESNVLSSTQDVKWLLNFLLDVSLFPTAANQLKENKAIPPLQNISSNHRDATMKLRAAIALCNILGKDESSGSQKSFLVEQPDVFTRLLHIFEKTLAKDIRAVNDLGLGFGILSLRVITGAIRTLSISDTNKPILLKSDVLTSLIAALKLFADNAPEVAANSLDTAGLKHAAGGGGDDELTAEVTIEALLQLSFNFEVDEKLRDVYHAACPSDHDLIEILSLCVVDARGKLDDEAKRNASALLKRLKPPVEDEADVVAAGPIVPLPESQKHIMLSYSWAVNKHLVVAVGKRLRELGHDVWRDEEGSNMVGPMSGDTDEKMAAAIEAAHTVVVFVSPQYKESANCRVEAKYAKQRQLVCPLKILYVMMSEKYHTRSNPPVDGWLALNIGTDLWYPLWNESMVGSTAQAIAGLVGNSNGGVTTVATDVPSPGKAAGASSGGSGAAVDWDVAYSFVSNVNNALDESALTEALSRLGVEDASDLTAIDKEDLVNLSKLLKKAKANKFLGAVNLLS